MLGFLDFLGTVGGNVLSLPGIVGVALGMMTRNWLIAGVLGAMIGVVQVVLFHHFRLDEIFAYDLVIAVAVGMVFATIGCAIRRRGALV